MNPKTHLAQVKKCQNHSPFNAVSARPGFYWLIQPVTCRQYPPLEHMFTASSQCWHEEDSLGFSVAPPRACEGPPCPLTWQDVSDVVFLTLSDEEGSLFVSWGHQVILGLEAAQLPIKPSGSRQKDNYQELAVQVQTRLMLYSTDRC